MTNKDPPSETGNEQVRESSDGEEDASLEKEEADKLREILRKKELSAFDSRPPVSRGTTREMWGEALQELQYHLFNDFFALIQGEERADVRCTCDDESDCFRSHQPFWFLGIVEILYLIIIGSLVALSYSIFHGLGLNPLTVKIIDSLHLLLYLNVVVHHLVDHVAATLDKVKMAVRHLRDH